MPGYTATGLYFKKHGREVLTLTLALALTLTLTLTLALALTLTLSRPKLAPAITASEKWIDDNFLRLQAWRKDFEKNQGREPTTADVTLADPEILGIARRLGAFGL